MFDKLKVEKVELVKRVIRQNNYDQFEKTHRQCLELGLNINRSALDRFASKLELIDKAQLSKRQQELQKLDYAAQQAREERMRQHSAKPIYQQQVIDEQYPTPEELQAERAQRNKTAPPPPSQRVVSSNVSREPQQRTSRRPSTHAPEMTYEQVKQRETEITFALGELKIRENELLQELINLTEMLDKSYKN